MSERSLVRKTLVYRLIRTGCILYLGLRHRMKVEGRENVPERGGTLVVANHQSFLDIPLIAAALRRHVCFVARRSLAESKLLAFIMRQCGAVLIDRGETDRGALREIAAHLAAGAEEREAGDHEGLDQRVGAAADRHVHDAGGAPLVGQQRDEPPAKDPVNGHERRPMGHGMGTVGHRRARIFDIIV